MDRLFWLRWVEYKIVFFKWKKGIKKMKKRIKGAKCLIYTLIIFLALSSRQAFAEDISWQKRNREILVNHSAVGDAIRYLVKTLTNLMAYLANILENLYNKTFGFIDVTNYPEINNIISMLTPVLVALIVLCLTVLGIILMVNREKRPVLRNILLGILAVSCSSYLFIAANSLTGYFKDGILGSGSYNYQSYRLVNDNMIDLVGIDKVGNTGVLNYSTGAGIVHNAGITDKTTLANIDFSETLNWSDEEKGRNLYGWSDTFNNKIRYRAVNVGDKFVSAENYNGVLKTTIGNEFYYRYSFDFWSFFLQCLAMIILFAALSYKNIRIAYELIIARILAYMHAADVTGGERLKQILFFIRDVYITLCISILSVKLFSVLSEAMPHLGINGISKGVISCFIAYVVIDGPNIAERIFGLDAGLSSSLARTAAVFGFATGAGRAVARGGHRAVNKVLGEKTRDMSVPQDGKRHGGLIEKFNGKGKQEAGNNSNSGSFVTTGKSKNHTGDIMNETGSSVKSDIYSSKGGSGLNTDFMNTSSSGEASGVMNDTGASSAAAPNINIPTESRKYSNPEFSTLVRNLKPGEGASPGERKDFNRQVTNIVRGNHKAIKPSDKSRAEYKDRNYQKAKKLEEAYKKRKKKGGKN